MSLTKKLFLRAIPVLLVVAVMVGGTVYGIDVPTTGSASDSLKTAFGNVYATIIVVVQWIAILCVVFAGLRYMMASANDKADIKKQTLVLVIGAILVFGATFVLGIIENFTNDTINQEQKNQEQKNQD